LREITTPNIKRHKEETSKFVVVFLLYEICYAENTLESSTGVQLKRVSKELIATDDIISQPHEATNKSPQFNKSSAKEQNMIDATT